MFGLCDDEGIYSDLRWLYIKRTRFIHQCVTRCPQRNGVGK